MGDSLKTLVIASKNKGKIAELKTLLSPLGISLKSMADIAFPDVEETGKTFEENALLKAETISSFTNLPTLADDSGLCVDALNGNPGVYTARYGTWKNLLTEMHSIETPRRQAHFACVLAFSIPHASSKIFKGNCSGFIAEKAKGEGGFGYDPIFIPKGYNKTFAEISPKEKHALSHRGKALELFMQYIKIYASAN